MLRVIVTFVVAALILYLSYVASKYVGKSANINQKSRYMRVIDKIVVGQDRYIAIVQIGIKYFLVGIASGQVNILSEVQEDDLVQINPTENTGKEYINFKDTYEKWKTMGKRGK